MGSSHLKYCGGQERTSASGHLILPVDPWIPTQSPFDFGHFQLVLPLMGFAEGFPLSRAQAFELRFR
jgi:hypothetical protein